MKIYFYLLLTALSILTACKDDDCVPGTLGTVIEGQWNVGANGIDFGDVEFKEDGTFVDEDEALVFNPNQMEMLYFVDSETQMRIRVMLITPVDYIVAVQDFGCDEIKLSVTGLDYTLKRK